MYYHIVHSVQALFKLCFSRYFNNNVLFLIPPLNIMCALVMGLTRVVSIFCCSDRVSHLWFGFGIRKIPLKIPNFPVFSLRVKKNLIRPGQKVTGSKTGPVRPGPISSVLCSVYFCYYIYHILRYTRQSLIPLPIFQQQ